MTCAPRWAAQAGSGANRITRSIAGCRCCSTFWRRSVMLSNCSLIIPTYHRPATAIALLEHLASMSDCPAEVIVVDGAPKDDKLGAWAKVHGIAYLRSP